MADPCPRCGGDKTVLEPVRPGVAKQRVECPACHGTGEVAEPEPAEVEADEPEEARDTRRSRRRR